MTEIRSAWRHPWRALTLAFALLLAACGDTEPRLAPLRDGAVILAFGDSLTRGTGAGRGEDYPSQLARLTGYTVINAGVPGELSEAGLKRLPRLLDEHQPDLVILCHGGNDILRNLDVGETEKNLRAMAQESRDAGAQVMLVAVPAKSLFLGDAELYERVADEMQLVLLSEVVADVLGERELKYDTVHPNAAGYEVIAQKIAEVLPR